MADIELVIKISEKIINEIKDNAMFADNIPSDVRWAVTNAIINGTPQELIHGKCNQCKYYEGVHNVQGHAPCSYHKIGGVIWNWYCSQFESEVEEWQEKKQ